MLFRYWVERTNASPFKPKNITRGSANFQINTADINAKNITNWIVLEKNIPASSLSFAPQFLAINAVDPAKTPVNNAWRIKVTLWPVTAAAIASGPRPPTTFIAAIELVA